ncbi:hypothetical protein B8W69_20845 [Mycobacterium vulneris]|uniref:Uncharacterized protein n=1 Tax=Mycolicibacterium vulneris TaxID=547163 RepID=A0A1X2KS63_9MYCO|nr:hypothetical protein B8W69_20845 [Mycolicibacterium vulneris]
MGAAGALGAAGAAGTPFCVSETPGASGTPGAPGTGGGAGTGGGDGGSAIAVPIPSPTAAKPNPPTRVAFAVNCLRFITTSPRPVDVACFAWPTRDPVKSTTARRVCNHTDQCLLKISASDPCGHVSGYANRPRKPRPHM